VVKQQIWLGEVHYGGEGLHWIVVQPKKEEEEEGSSRVYWGMDLYLHPFLSSALVGGEFWASRPGRTNSG